ncbi:hypothetical protein O7635_03860 [Asanoa sp. WMMD1127]|uniref:hypothetical protein n=1 Tax=Asanoa sp. WMMD1127 TaxID=3016107 RepID=UPI002416E6BC|nr:hypothetical protein [Asanoa sp. WMMD1127]MDG4820989.1 hypothetical protein [Asanoa sp. WMMD1127]
MLNDADLPTWSQGAVAEARNSISRFGCLRARLSLVDPAVGGRRHPVFAGWRVAWNIGNRADGQRPDNDAIVLPEGSSSISPGGASMVLVVPIYPNRWVHVESGDVLRMRDGNRIIGSATVVDRVAPTNEHLVGRWPPFTIVRFLHDLEGFPAGTTATIVDVFADGYEVEIEGESGETTGLAFVGDDDLEWRG